MSGTMFLGTSGFAYTEWKGTFYPSDIRERDMLTYYATHMNSVEINYTFQRTAAETTIDRWLTQTPPLFRFSLKAHRAITHIRRLVDVGDRLKEFLKSVAPLGERVGAVLFQFPPTLPADQPLLDDFLAQLPPGRYACEFRHESWTSDATRATLARRGVAWCAADTDDSDAVVDRTTPDFAYIRLRKTTYDDEALGRWIASIEQILGEDADVYCYFKHEDEGRGARYAARLASLRRDALS